MPRRIGRFRPSGTLLASRKPNTAFRQVPESNHYVQAEYPRDVITAIDEWVPTLR